MAFIKAMYNGNDVLLNTDYIVDECELIEIDDEIWEALKPKVETMSLAKKGWITDDSNT